MKKLFYVLSFILISIISNGQIVTNTRLDTVFARNLPFTYEELSNCKGLWTPRDQTEKKFFKKLAAVVNAVPNKVNATIITVDSLPGPIAVLWYANFRKSTEGETAGFSNNIKTRIKGYPPLTADCQAIDKELDDKRQNNTQNGKEDW